jgi:hypothetical protein
VKNLGPQTSRGLYLATEWIAGEINSTGQTRATQLSSLRNKIKSHLDSQSHITAANVMAKKREEAIACGVAKQWEGHHESTKRVFRSVCYLIKHHRPHSDLTDLMDLQQQNGVDVGVMLHSRYSAPQATLHHVADEMRHRTIGKMIETQSKFAIIVDESTTISTKSVLSIHLRTHFGD